MDFCRHHDADAQVRYPSTDLEGKLAKPSLGFALRRIAQVKNRSRVDLIRLFADHCQRNQ